MSCGLNFADILLKNGTYQETPELPFVLGMEVSGVVDALGSNVTNFSIGDRVAVFGGQGGLAEFGCFDVSRCAQLPRKMNFDDAAAFQIAYGTSHLALGYKAQTKPGDTLLVLGASGGVGLTAVQIGKLMGARVVGVARGTEKIEIIKKEGADFVLDSDDPDLVSRLKNLGGIDIVYDAVGGDQFKSAFKSCNPEARIILIGFASGNLPQLKANHLLVKNVTVHGFYWGGFLQFKPGVVTESLKQLFEWYESGHVKPHISHKFTLDQAEDALELLKNRKSTGKVVVKIHES
jgi:NADPH2:quinone reductase